MIFVRDPHISGEPQDPISGTLPPFPYESRDSGMGVGLGSRMGGWGSHCWGVPGISLETNVDPKKGTFFFKRKLSRTNHRFFQGTFAGLLRGPYNDFKGSELKTSLNFLLRKKHVLFSSTTQLQHKHVLFVRLERTGNH